MHVPDKLDVFRHNCYPFSMYGTEVGVFQKPNQICLCSFLETQYGMYLEVQVIFAPFKGYLMD